MKALKSMLGLCYGNGWTDPAQAETFWQRIVSSAFLLPQGFFIFTVIILLLVIGIPRWLITGRPLDEE